MSDCGCGPSHAETASQRQVLWIALFLNAAMFVIEGAVGTFVKSTGLIADGFDMLADASAYGIALAALGRGAISKARAATISGSLLLLVGVGIVIDVLRRTLWGSDPEGDWMISISFMALAVNVYVLRLINNQRSTDVHMRVAGIFTRVDVTANAAVIVAGLAVIATGSRYFDLAVGGAIGAYVIKEALEILFEARTA